MVIQQTTLTIPLTDLSPAIQAQLAAGRRVDIASGAARVAVLVPIEPAALSPTEALAAITRLLDQADAAGYGEALRNALREDEPGRWPS